MYCQYCGENLEDNATFCKNCGKPIKEQKTSTKVNKKIIILAAIAVLAVIGIIAVLGSSSKYIKVDAAKLFTVSFEGLDGDGIAIVEIDETEWGKIADQVVVTGSSAEMTNLMSLQMLHFDLSKDSYLSNGDEITLTFDIPEDFAETSGFKVSNIERTIKVDGLAVPEEIDVFEGLEVEFSGRSPYITCNIVTGNCNDFTKDYVTFKTDKMYYANGESVEVEAYYSSNILVEEKVKVLSDTAQFEAISNERYLDTVDGVDLTQLEDKIAQQLQLEYNAAGDQFAGVELGFCNHYVGMKEENLKGSAFLALRDKYDFLDYDIPYNSYVQHYRIKLDVFHKHYSGEYNLDMDIDVLMIINNLYTDENDTLYYDDLVIVEAAEFEGTTDLKSVYIKDKQEMYNVVNSEN